MNINLVHISDLHLREGWVEEQGFVLNSFVSDLKEQVRSKDKLFFVFRDFRKNYGSCENGCQRKKFYFSHSCDSTWFQHHRSILAPCRAISS